MSKPSIIEIEPSNSNFTLKYNNGGKVENVISINPIDKTIDGNNMTLENFNYTGLTFDAANVDKLTASNIEIEGDVTTNTSKLRGTIKYDTFTNQGFTFNISDEIVSDNLFISPDKSFIIISGIIQNLHNYLKVPSLILCKYNYSTKKYEFKLDIIAALQKRYKEASTGVVTDVHSLETILPAKRSFYNSTWEVSILKGDEGRYDRLIMVHKHSFLDAIADNTDRDESYTLYNTPTTAAADFVVTSGTLSNVAARGEYYGTTTPSTYNAAASGSPSGTTLYVLQLISDYSDISQGEFINNTSSLQNEIYSSSKKFLLFNDAQYIPQTVGNTLKASLDNSAQTAIGDVCANLNSIQNFILDSETNASEHTSVSPDIQSELIQKFHSSDSQHYSGYYDVIGYTPTGNIKDFEESKGHFLFEAGGYSGIQSLKISSNEYMIIIPFMTNEKKNISAAGSKNYKRTFIFMYKLYWSNDRQVLSGVNTNGSPYKYVIPNHSLEFYGRTEIGYDGVQFLNSHSKIPLNFNIQSLTSSNSSTSNEFSSTDSSNPPKFGCILRENTATNLNNFGGAYDETSNPKKNNKWKQYNLFAHVSLDNTTAFKNKLVMYKLLIHLNAPTSNRSPAEIINISDTNHYLKETDFHLNQLQLYHFINNISYPTTGFSSHTVKYSNLFDFTEINTSQNSANTGIDLFSNINYYKTLDITQTYFTNLIINNDSKFLAISSPNFSPYNLSSQSKESGLVFIFNLNNESNFTGTTNCNLTTYDPLLGGSSNYSDYISSNAIQNIKAIQIIDHPSVDCDKTGYIHMGADMQLCDINNESYLLVGIPGDRAKQLTVSTYYDIDTDFKGAINVFKMDNINTVISPKYIFNMILELSSDTNYEFGKHFITNNDMKEIFVYNESTESGTAIGEYSRISFNNKFSIIGEDASYNSLNHYFNNKVHINDTITIKTANIELLQTDSLSMNKITFVKSDIEYNTLSKSLDIYNNGDISGTVLTNIVANVSNINTDIQYSSLSYPTATFLPSSENGLGLQVPSYISNNQKYIIGYKEVSYTTTYGKPYIFINEYHPENATNCPIIIDSIMLTTATPPANLDYTFKWHFISNITDRYLFCCLTYSMGSQDARNLTQFYVIKLTKNFKAIDSGFGIKSLDNQIANVFIESRFDLAISEDTDKIYISVNNTHFSKTIEYLFLSLDKKTQLFTSMTWASPQQGLLKNMDSHFNSIYYETQTISVYKVATIDTTSVSTAYTATFTKATTVLKIDIISTNKLLIEYTPTTLATSHVLAIYGYSLTGTSLVISPESPILEYSSNNEVIDYSIDTASNVVLLLKDTGTGNNNIFLVYTFNSTSNTFSSGKIHTSTLYATPATVINDLFIFNNNSKVYLFGNEDIKIIDYSADITKIQIKNNNITITSDETNITNRLNVKGDTTIIGSVDITGQTNFYDTLTISGTTGITGQTSITGITNITGDTNITGHMSIYDTLFVSGTTGITGQTSITGITNITGDTNITGNISIYDTLFVSGTTGITGQTSITGITNITGDTNITGHTSIYDTLFVSGTTGITGQTSITGITNITGDTNITGTTSIYDTLFVSGTTGITGQTSITGNTHITGATNITGVINFSGTTDITGLTTITGPNINITGLTNITGNTYVNGNLVIKQNLDVVGEVNGNILENAVKFKNPTLINNTLNLIKSSPISSGYNAGINIRAYLSYSEIAGSSLSPGVDFINNINIYNTTSTGTVKWSFITLNTEAHLVKNSLYDSSDNTVKALVSYGDIITAKYNVISAAIANNEFIFASNHLLTQGQAVVYTLGTGSAVTELTNGATYYVLAATSTTNGTALKLSATDGGAALTITGSGIGNVLTFLSQSVDSVTNNEFIFPTNHLFTPGQSVVYTSGTGSEATGLTNGTTYYVLAATSTTNGTALKLSATDGGAALTITGSVNGHVLSLSYSPKITLKESTDNPFPIKIMPIEMFQHDATTMRSKKFTISSTINDTYYFECASDSTNIVYTKDIQFINNSSNGVYYGTNINHLYIGDDCNYLPDNIKGGDLAPLVISRGFHSSPISQNLSKDSNETLLIINNNNPMSYIHSSGIEYNNTASLQFNSYNHYSTSCGGTVKLSGTHKPKATNSGAVDGIFNIDTALDGKWNTNALELNQRGDLHINGGLSQYNKYHQVNINFTESFISGAVLTGNYYTAFINDGVISKIKFATSDLKAFTNNVQDIPNGIYVKLTAEVNGGSSIDIYDYMSGTDINNTSPILGMRNSRTAKELIDGQAGGCSGDLNTLKIDTSVYRGAGWRGFANTASNISGPYINTADFPNYYEFIEQSGLGVQANLSKYAHFHTKIYTHEEAGTKNLYINIDKLNYVSRGFDKTINSPLTFKTNIYDDGGIIHTLSVAAVINCIANKAVYYIDPGKLPTMELVDQNISLYNIATNGLNNLSPITTFNFPNMLYNADNQQLINKTPNISLQHSYYISDNNKLSPISTSNKEIETSTLDFIYSSAAEHRRSIFYIYIDNQGYDIKISSGNTPITKNPQTPHTSKLTSAVVTNSELVFSTAHGFSAGTAVIYNANSQTAISPLIDGDTYYVIDGSSSTTMKLAHSLKDTLSSILYIAITGGAAGNSITDSHIKFLNEASAYMNTDFYRGHEDNGTKDDTSLENSQINYFSPIGTFYNSSPISFTDFMTKALTTDKTYLNSGMIDRVFHPIAFKSKYSPETTDNTEFVILTSMEPKATDAINSFYYQDWNDYTNANPSVNYSITRGYNHSGTAQSAPPTVLNSVDSYAYVSNSALSPIDLSKQRVLRIVWTGKPIIIYSDYNCYFQDIVIDIASDYKTSKVVNNFVSTSSYKRAITIPVTIITKTSSDTEYFINTNTTNSFMCWQKWGRFGVFYRIAGDIDESYSGKSPIDLSTSQGASSTFNILHGAFSTDNLIDWETNKTINYLIQIKFYGDNNTNNPDIKIVKLSEIDHTEIIPSGIDTGAFSSL